MSLAFNTLLDRWKHRFLHFTGETEFRDHLLRSICAYRDFKLTAAQLDALNATPITLIPAPGAGKVIVVEGVFTKVDFIATRLELGAGTLAFKYTDGSGAEVATAVTNTQVELNADAYYRSIAAAVVPVVNAPIVAHATADVTAGDSVIYGRIWYRVVKVAELV